MKFIKKSKSSNKASINLSVPLSTDLSNTSNTSVSVVPTPIAFNSSMGNFTSSNNSSSNTSSVKNTHETTSSSTSQKMATSSNTNNNAINNSKQTLLILPTSSLGGSSVSSASTAATTTTGISNPVMSQFSNHQNTFVLPALNVSAHQQSLRNASNLDFNFKPHHTQTTNPATTTTTIPSHSDVRILFKNGDGGGGGGLAANSNQFSMPKTNTTDYRSKLNDAKAFLENENSQLRSKNNDKSENSNKAGKSFGLIRPRYEHIRHFFYSIKLD